MFILCFLHYRRGSPAHPVSITALLPHIQYPIPRLSHSSCPRPRCFRGNSAACGPITAVLPRITAVLPRRCFLCSADTELQTVSRLAIELDRSRRQRDGETPEPTTAAESSEGLPVKPFQRDGLVTHLVVSQLSSVISKLYYLRRRTV